jgi:glycosyltransferase involved in cell wall biosynthesis
MAGPTVQFLGYQKDEVIREHFRKARAVLFPAEEDFGIVPVEAQACGCPVIAFGKGGATETVRGLDAGSEATGVFFQDQTVDSVISAMEQFEGHEDRFDPRAARRNALPFRRERFVGELSAYVDEVWGGQTLRRAA